ncbi:MAG: DUF748 domain-containing protein, partial [Gammaproteobacteria bacterium]|nr:DUF748 domain-containing protein [Gammaproteobacteria bacterium]
MPNLLKSKLFWATAIPVALVGLYALFGFKVAPSIARDQAQAFVREHYQRELAIGSIAIHPFKLQAEVRDLALPDADGRPMLGFQRLFVDFEIASLWNRAFTFKDVTIEAPQIRAVVRPDGSLNLADLALPEEEPEEPTPSVWVQHLGVERGAIEFTDESRPTPLSRSFRAVGFALEDFRTTPEGGDFSFSARSPQDETFDWKGRFALEPVISSQGEFRIGALHAPGLLDFLGDTRPFTLTQGRIDLNGTYRVSLGDEIELGVDLPSIALTDLSLRARDAESDWVLIPSLVVSGTSLALPAQTVAVQKVTLDGLEADAWMSADGSINLEQLLAFETAAEPQDAAPPAAPAKPWTVTVGGIELTNAAVAFEDRTLTPASKFDLKPVNLRVSDVSLDLSRPLPVQLDAVINGHARFDASGTLTPEPLAAELDVKLAKARMQILQPYVLPVADLTITGGELDVQGKATLAPPGGDAPEMAFAGDVAIDGFRSIDNALDQDLVSFKRLELSKLRFAMAPDSLTIDRVLVHQPYARVIISPEQVINIAAVLDPKGTAEALAQRRAEAAAESARSPAERRRLEKERAAAERAAAKARKDGTAPPPVQEPAPADTFPIRIREIRVDGGRMNFSDFFVKPNFSADVQQLSGTITGASSAYDSRAKVSLTGKLDEFSPVSIQGELQPFAFDRYTDVGLKFENISLPIFNPYSTPLAGYNIAKGKLTTDLHYTIVDRKLDAQHKIRIDQLEWGEATATQGEATLPVKFATSLLKDKDGVINLDVPVGGTLDDPSFRIGPIIWQVIKNIIVKAVTAPFSLLGSLFAGAEDAQYIDFAPGEATLDAATAERLGALAKSLAEKPELKLDVPIGALAELDQPALKERAYLAALEGAVAAHFAKKVKQGEPVPSYATLEADKKIDVLTELVKQQTGAIPQVPESPEPPEGTPRAEAKAQRQAAAVEYLETAARSGVSVPDTELANLAEERAAAVERALLGGGALDPTRVFKVR